MDNFYTDLIGKKWRKNARGPNEFDCYHLVKEVQRRRGYFLPEIETPEGVELRLKMFEKLASEYAEPLDRPEPFCVVIIDMGKLAPLHVGVVLENCQQFIHAAAYIRRVRIDRLNSILFKKRIFGYYRLIKKVKENK